MVVSPSSLPPAALSPVATTRETQPHSSSSNDNPTSKMMAGLLIGTASGHVVRRTSSYRTVLLAKAHAEHQSVAQKEEKSTTRRHASSHSVGMSVRVRPTTQRNAEWGGMATTVGPLSPGAMCPAPPRYQSLPARYRQQHAAHLQQPAKDVIFAKKSDLRRVTSLTAMPHYENSRTDNSQEEEEEARSQTHHLSNGWEAPSTTTATTTTTGRAPLHEYLSKKGMGGSRLANLATASRVKMLSHTSGISATAAAAATTGVRKGGEGGGAQESLQKLLSRGYTTNNGGLRASRHTASAFSLASASLASSTASSAGDSVAATYSPRRSPPPPPPPPKVVLGTTTMRHTACPAAALAPRDHHLRATTTLTKASNQPLLGRKVTSSHQLLNRGTYVPSRSSPVPTSSSSSTHNATFGSSSSRSRGPSPAPSLSPQPPPTTGRRTASCISLARIPSRNKVNKNNSANPAAAEQQSKPHRLLSSRYLRSSCQDLFSKKNRNSRRNMSSATAQPSGGAKNATWFEQGERIASNKEFRIVYHKDRQKGSKKNIQSMEDYFESMQQMAENSTQATSILSSDEFSREIIEDEFRIVKEGSFGDMSQRQHSQPRMVDTPPYDQ